MPCDTTQSLPSDWGPQWCLGGCSSVMAALERPAISRGGEHLLRGRERQPEGVRHRAAGDLGIVHVKPVAKMRIFFQCPRETLVCQD